MNARPRKVVLTENLLNSVKLKHTLLGDIWKNLAAFHHPLFISKDFLYIYLVHPNLVQLKLICFERNCFVCLPCFKSNPLTDATDVDGSRRKERWSLLLISISFQFARSESFVGRTSLSVSSAGQLQTLSWQRESKGPGRPSLALIWVDGSSCIETSLELNNVDEISVCMLCSFF